MNRVMKKFISTVLALALTASVAAPSCLAATGGSGGGLTQTVHSDYDYIGNFKGGQAMAIKGNTIGILKTDGTFTAFTGSYSYDAVNSLYITSTISYTILDLTQNKKDKYLLSTGAEYDTIGERINYFYRKVSLNGKYGLIDKSGKLVLSCNYDDIYSFGYIDVENKYSDDGIVAVKLNGKWGCVKLTGDPSKPTVAIPFSFASSTFIFYKNDRAAAYMTDNTRVLIDKSGKILSKEYSLIASADVNNNYTTDGDKSNNYTHDLLNKDGKVLATSRDYIDPDSNGNYIIANTDQTYSLLSPSGAVITSGDDDIDEADSNGYYVVMDKNCDYTLIDKTGTVILSGSQLSKDDTGDFGFKNIKCGADGIYTVQFYNETYGFMKVTKSAAGYNSQRLFSDLSLRDAGTFSAYGIAPVKSYNYSKWGVINENGKTIVPFDYSDTDSSIPIDYDQISVTSAGYIIGQYHNIKADSDTDEKWVVLRDDKDTVTQITKESDNYTNISDLYGNTFAVTTSGGVAAIDGNDKVFIPADAGYSSISNYIGNNFYLVQKDNYYGVLNSDGSVLLPTDRHSLYATMWTHTRYWTDTDSSTMTGIDYGTNDDSNSSFLDISAIGIVPDYSSYTSISSLPNGCFIVQKDGCQGVISGSGKAIIPISAGYSSVDYNFTDKTYLVTKKLSDSGAGSGFVSSTGTVMVDPNEGYSYVYSIDGTNLFHVMKGDYQGINDASGKKIIPVDAGYSEVDYANGVFCVKKDGKWALVGADGKLITQFSYTNLYPDYTEDSGLFIFSTDSSAGKLDKTGKVVYTSNDCNDLKYYYSDAITNGLCVVGKTSGGSTQYGLMDSNWNLLLPCSYKQIIPQEDDNNLVVTEDANSKYGVYSLKSISKISMNKNPTKTSYAVGQKLDLSGASITVTYSDKTTKTVNVSSNNVTVSGYDSSKAGKQTVTLTYGGFSTSFTVTVGNSAPTFGKAVYSATAITNKNVTVTVTVSGATVPSLSHVFTVNGSYTFTAVNAAGVKATLTVKVSNIDKTNPAITANIGNGKVSTAPVTVSVSDANLASKAATLNGKTISWGNGIFSSKGKYVITAMDKAGNKSTYKFTIK